METPTQRFAPDSERPNHKIDWFFTRGLDASDPKIVPAIREGGLPSSDHECLVVTVRPKMRAG
jgi:endonuclease/exonuclease/phosphatase (EEP) superfamily protein YafD